MTRIYNLCNVAALPLLPHDRRTTATRFRHILLRLSLLLALFAGPTVAGRGQPVTKISGTAVNNLSIGTLPWMNPEWINTDNHSFRAQVEFQANTISNYLQGSNYGFSIPENATITGIQVELKMYTLAIYDVRPYYYSLRLVKDGTILSHDKITTPSPMEANGSKCFGSSQDLWGADWTPEDINNPGFGVVFSCSSTVDRARADVHYMKISVSYTMLPEITSFSPVAAYSGSEDEVVITGNYFTGVTDVKFHDNVSAAFTVDSPSQITATLPEGATTGKIRVITADGTATSAGDFVVKAPVVWLGGSADWADEDNWQGGIPIASAVVVIPAGLDHYPEISPTTVARCKKLTMEQGASLTILSDCASTGSLIVSGTAGTGTYIVRRWIPDELAGDDWHIISCPVSGSMSMQQWAASQQVNPGMGDYDLAPYAEKVGSNAWGDWYPFISQTGTDGFSPGKGYAMRRVLHPTDGYVTFTGNCITAGQLKVAITRNSNGWNALGNPYVSAISIPSFLITNTITSNQLARSPDNVIYIYNPKSGSYTGTKKGNIAPGQGFIVRSKLDGGIITFNTGMQTPDTATFKNAEIPMATAHLKVKGGKLTAVATVMLGEGMTTGIDNWQDIGIFKGNPDIALYTRMPDDDTYDLQDQALPLPGETALVVPVGFDYVPGGEVSFSLTTENFNGLQVYLEDTQNGSRTLLSGEGLAYTADVAAKSSGAGRFYLVFEKSATVGAGINKIKKEFTVYTRNSEIVINGEADLNTRLELFTIDGRCLYRKKARPGNLNSIDGSPFPAGIYLLKISGENLVRTTKIVLPE